MMRESCRFAAIMIRSPKANTITILYSLFSIHYSLFQGVSPMKKEAPSVDLWLREAKASPEAAGCGMFLVHNGVVRRSARAAVREGAADTAPVRGMLFGYDAAKAAAAERDTLAMPGIRYVRVWLNEGKLSLGDDIMLVLVGGDIRPHVVEALQYLVGRLKGECVTEKELY